MTAENQHLGVTSEFELYEKARQRIQAKTRIIHVIFAAALIVFLITINKIEIGIFALFGIFAIIGGWTYCLKNENKNFASLFKKSVIIPALKARFPNLTYASQGIVKQAFLSSELFSANNVDRYNSEDEFRGIHGNTKFRFSEVHAERHESGTDGGGSYRTIFQGVFLIADFNKNLKGSTKIIQERDNFLKKLWHQKSRVSLEHEEFESTFNTFSEDQVEARYILSTTMMERILKLQKKWNNKLHISFIKDHIFLAINHDKNLFEPNLDQEINNDQLNRIYSEITACLEIIDLLDLNTRIWTK